MHRKLTTEQIREVCTEMLSRAEGASVSSVMIRLRERHGACGRTARVAKILSEALSELQRRPAENVDVVVLRRELAEAERRAARAEELERRHQDFWAARYQEKVEELQGAMSLRNPPGVSSEQYLRLYQRAAELARRLSRYEEVEPLLPGVK
jgi:hypothetical protein